MASALSNYATAGTGIFSFGSGAAAADVPPFDPWLYDINPEWRWDWAHLRLIRKELKRMADGDIDKLMIFMPPRHGKSEMTTVRFSSWWIERDPAQRVIIGAYSQTLANKFSRKVRKIVRSRMPLSAERTAADDWETEQGGGVRAAGVGAGVTGMGGDLIIIDDPIKNREEANSPVYREKVWNWYTDDLYTRREPGARMILIQTRWHEDDLAGRILASEDGGNWTVLTLPALAEADDALGREVGAALCPDRYNEADLLDIRTAIGSRPFTALYQQRPVEQEGDFFKRSWFELVRESPREANRVRYWDKGATVDGDYTVGVLMAEVDGQYFVEDVVRGQWTSFERNQWIKTTAIVDGNKVDVWLEQEPGSSGLDSVNEIIKLLGGYTVRADKVTGNKALRAEPFAAQAEAGNVKLVRAAWNNSIIDELASFPHGSHDDQVDAVSGAFQKVAINIINWSGYDKLGSVKIESRWS